MDWKETIQWIISTGVSFLDVVRLHDDLVQLRTSLPRARALIHRADWGRFKNKDLAVLFSQLKDTSSDAEDLIREFEYQELWRKIHTADKGKRGQLFSYSANFARNLYQGSKSKVITIQAKLDKVATELEGLLNLLGLNVEPVQLGKPLMPETSSIIKEPVVFGRDSERDQVIALLSMPLRGSSSFSFSYGKTATIDGLNSNPRAKRMKGESSRAGRGSRALNTTGVVSVLPIVGIGGVGKTTLVQLVYNDPRVKAHFDLRMWVCISDVFDIKRIIKDIIECSTNEVCDMSRSLDVLQGELRKKLMQQKFLLVLDDIWLSAIDEWQTFFAPFRDVHEGSVILVTTRFEKIANLVTNIRAVELKGLPADTFWEFFKICAFGTEGAKLHPKLQLIGRNIASRLCGSPLAAKTLGRLLNMELTEQHWITIQNSELWELPHQDNELLPALQLSYLYLPPELKKCLALCSIFPKDYSFKRDELVDIWVTHGFVLSMHPEDLADAYLDDLRSRFLLQTDPKFHDPNRYVMHDLIHDMAQSVSLDECFLLEDRNYPNKRKIPPTVRHMSIEVRSQDQRIMADIHYLDKLHTLRFRGTCTNRISLFNQLSNILFLSIQDHTLEKLPESICDLNHLRHLDISYSRITELPENFGCLYSLQVLNASHSSLKTMPDDISKLINLRKLALPVNASKNLSTKTGLGNLSSLRNLSYFTVGKGNGRKFGELKNMNQLRGMLVIEYFSNVQSMEEAAEARIGDKQYLKALTIQWRQCRFFPKEHGHDNSNVLEGLHPHSRIEHLVFEGFQFDNFSPSWLTPDNLPSLANLDLSHCCLKYLSISLRLPLTTLRLSWCCDLKNLDQCLCPEYLPFVKSIELDWCPNLVSVPVHNFVGFVFLQDLKIHQCWKLVCPKVMVLPPALRRLSVSFCGELGNSFPDCLANLTFLTVLHLEACLTIRLITLNSTNTNMLSSLVLRHCPELSCIDTVHGTSRARKHSVSS